MVFQNYSVAVRLKKDKMNARGLCPIAIRVIVNRKASFLCTSFRIAHNDWDEEQEKVRGRATHAALINQFLDELVRKAKEFLYTAGLSDQYVTAKEVINSLKQSSSRDDLLAYWEEMLDELKGIQHKNTIHQFRSDYHKLASFRSSITFSQVTPKFLQEFEQYMALVLLNSQNTRWKTFKNLKKIFNLARRDKRTHLYPFDAYNCPKYQQRIRTYLTMEEIDQIEALITAGILPRSLWITANYFLLCCYCGLRYQDLRAFDPMQHQNQPRLVLSTLKTGEVVSIYIHKRLKIILQRLSSRPGLFTNQKVNEYLKEIALLAKIEKNLTVHVGRHTFAVTCADLGMSADVVMKLLGHNNVQITRIYYKITDKVVDAEMAKWDLI